MDRPPRLRRYQKKDYSQRVEFPVEIVGRDNHVRRYAFDDAVQLYHRRIETAATRYADPETVDAEVRHCRLRIEQLRRSYIAAAGALRPAAGGGLLAGPLAADLLFFLRRVLGEAADAAAATLAPLEGGATEAWWCQTGPGGAGAVLYAFRLDGEGPPGARQALEGVLARLRAAALEPGAERLYVGTVTPDVALLLAGTEAWSGPSGLLQAAPTPGAAPGEPPADAWHAAMVALQEGQVQGALRQLEAALDAEPTRRVLARAATVVALIADEPVRAEFVARFGLVEAPADPLLRYLCALALVRQGRAAEALPESARAGATGGLALLHALHLLSRGRLVAAWRSARRARLGTAENEWFVHRAARSVGITALSTLGVRGAAACGVLAAGLLAFAGEPLEGGAAALGFAAFAAFAELHTRRTAATALRVGRVGAIRLCPPELLPREGEAPRH